MKSIFIAIALLITTQSLNSQDTSFIYTETGINETVEIQCPGKDIKHIYTKSLNWIKEYYKNPDKVIEMTIENEKTRFQAYSSDLLKVKKMYLGMKYNMEIEAKEGAYILRLNELTSQGTDYKNLPNFKTNKKLIKNFKGSPERIEAFFNELNRSLNEYVNK